jgi:NH3-dependent NAD+ synthetase
LKGLEEYAIAEALGVPEESLRAVPTDGLDIIPGGTDEDQLGLPYHELDRVIVRLLQNKFDGTRRYPPADSQRLVEQVAHETGLANEKVLHVASQLANSHYKRRWPQVVTREEIGLVKIDDLDVISMNMGKK